MKILSDPAPLPYPYLKFALGSTHSTPSDSAVTPMSLESRCKGARLELGHEWNLNFEKLSLQHTPLHAEKNDPILASIWIYSLDLLNDVVDWDYHIYKTKLLIARNQFVQVSHKWHNCHLHINKYNRVT